MRPFRLVERDVRPGCREIRVEGELDFAVAGQLREMLEGIAEECTEILIGLQSCEFIDSTGIAVVVSAHQQLAKQGRRVAMYAPTSQVLRILSVTGLTSNGLVFESLDKALLGSEQGSAPDQP